ncbi:hypothetical protein A2U01_0092580, partial [Trifolium medium]|nr:hypothetical protein [Trifolium medium]
SLPAASLLTDWRDAPSTPARRADDRTISNPHQHVGATHHHPLRGAQLAEDLQHNYKM